MLSVFLSGSWRASRLKFFESSSSLILTNWLGRALGWVWLLYCCDLLAGFWGENAAFLIGKVFLPQLNYPFAPSLSGYVTAYSDGPILIRFLC